MSKKTIFSYKIDFLYTTDCKSKWDDNLLFITKAREWLHWTNDDFRAFDSNWSLHIHSQSSTLLQFACFPYDHEIGFSLIFNAVEPNQTFMGCMSRNTQKNQSSCCHASWHDMNRECIPFSPFLSSFHSKSVHLVRIWKYHRTTGWKWEHYYPFYYWHGNCIIIILASIVLLNNTPHQSMMHYCEAQTDTIIAKMDTRSSSDYFRRGSKWRRRCRELLHWTSLDQ